MAKVKHTERTVVVTKDVIVCSRCGVESALSGTKAIQKWEGRDWLCLDCGGNGNRPLPLCTCGHRKSRHSGGKSICTTRIKEAVPHRMGKYNIRYCPCNRYQPVDEENGGGL